ncbi:lipoprotein [Psychrobium sp. 1_MG-2023]|nr:lipoprotein [Psychrobium sp. 1_MG-2023]MDP2562010.1 lipoprotein [Psychrobium sp. 1_MG-2023]PKF58610.1 hypothetical protein CW748_02965 [Alteromonadales bacterium alter-6D02]
MLKLTIFTVLLILLSGCGQKGPLYHDKPEQQKNQPQPTQQKEQN